MAVGRPVVWAAPGKRRQVAIAVPGTLAGCKQRSHSGVRAPGYQGGGAASRRAAISARSSANKGERAQFQTPVPVKRHDSSRAVSAVFRRSLTRRAIMPVG